MLTDSIGDSSPIPLSINILDNNFTVLGMPSWLCWVLIGVMLIISGLFSASENAFSNCNKYHFKVKAEEGNVTAKIIVRLTEKFEDTLVSILVGNNIVQTLMSFLSAIMFYNLLKGTALAQYEAIFSTIVMAALVYIVSDTVPKILSKAIPNRMAVILAWPDFIVSILLFPIILIFRLVLKGVHKILKVNDENFLTREDFMEKADEAISDEDINNETEELFEPNEMNMIKKAFAFDTIEISKVLIPLDKVEMININGLTIEELNSFIMNNSHSRFPVYEDERDNILGILSINNYFKEYAEDAHLEIRSILKDPVIVSEEMKVDEVFEELNKEKVHMGLVKDKEGKLIGMVTMEDILSQLVDDKSLLKQSEVK